MDDSPALVASWVGYDLNGRRDIQWSDTIRQLGRKGKLKIIGLAKAITESTTSPKGLVDFIVTAKH